MSEEIKKIVDKHLEGNYLIGSLQRSLLVKELEGYKNTEQEEKKCAEYVKASKLRKEYSEATNIKDRGIYDYSEWLEAKIEPDHQSVDIPKILTDFFIHWYNAKGNNTSEGAKDWWKENKAKYAPNQDKLREAAEVLEWMKSEEYTPPFNEIVKKLEKALK